MAGIDQILEGRMAEWLRSRVFIAENGLNIRRISVGLKPCALKKVHRLGGFLLKSRPVVTMAGIDQILYAGYAEVQILLPTQVHKPGGWC